MFRNYLIVLILSLAFVLCGCSTIQRLDGTSEEEMKIFKMDKKEMYDNMKRLEIENEKNQRLRVENEEKLGRLTDRNESLNQEVGRLKEEKQKIAGENESLKSQLAKIEPKEEASGLPAPKIETDIGRLKIKVLCGNGNLDSARSMAKRLRNMGYKIDLIDHAQRSDFDETTIYFEPTRKNEARHLRSKLNNDPVLKPLSWPTIFDLIVVTGPLE